MVANRLMGVFFALVMGISMAVSAKESVDKEQVAVFAKKIVDDLNQRNEAGFAEAVDVAAVVDRAIVKIAIKGNDAKEFKIGALQASSAMPGQFVRQLEASDDHVKLMRITHGEQEHRVLARISSLSGSNYVEFVVSPKGVAYKIVDWVLVATGKMMSDSLAEVALLMLNPESNPLFPNQRIDMKMGKQIGQLMDLVKGQKMVEAYDLYQQLPDSIKYSHFIIFSMAGAMPLEHPAYKKVLADLASHYGDKPESALMLLDHYLLDKNYNAAMGAIDVVEKRIGADASLNHLRSVTSFMANDYDKALFFAQQAIKQEADFETAYFDLGQAYIAKKQFAEAVENYKKLEKMGYQFQKAKLVEDPFMANFVKSAVFKKWLK